MISFVVMINSILDNALLAVFDWNVAHATYMQDRACFWLQIGCYEGTGTFSNYLTWSRLEISKISFCFSFFYCGLSPLSTVCAYWVCPLFSGTPFRKTHLCKGTSVNNLKVHPFSSADFSPRSFPGNCQDAAKNCCLISLTEIVYQSPPWH